MNLDPSTATGSDLDKLIMLAIPHKCRISYGSDESTRPNGNCYWDADLGLWIENDQHFRARIKGEA